MTSLGRDRALYRWVEPFGKAPLCAFGGKGSPAVRMHAPSPRVPRCALAALDADAVGEAPIGSTPHEGPHEGVASDLLLVEHGI